MLPTEFPHWLRFALPVFMLAVGLPLLPAALPVFEPEKEARYFAKLKNLPGMEAPLRWEDGNYYPLPQDFADMLAWEELADLVGKTWQSLPDKSTVAIYAENYGQAGAIEHFGRQYGVPQVLSFSDAYRYWLPDSLPANFQTLIYVNDELGDDMPGFFAEIQEVGRVQTPYAREHGTQVYLCRQPSAAFFERIETAIRQAKSGEDID